MLVSTLDGALLPMHRYTVAFAWDSPRFRLKLAFKVRSVAMVQKPVCPTAHRAEYADALQDTRGFCNPPIFSIGETSRLQSMTLDSVLRHQKSSQL